VAARPIQSDGGHACGRLKADPHNAAGWRRLIRAYTVLGQPDDAKNALATARKTFAGDRDVLAALDADAKT